MSGVLCAGGWLLLLAIAAPAFHEPCEAQPREARASVLWLRADRVYIGLGDSSAIAPGERLTFLDRGKPIATAEVIGIHDGELAQARLTSGSLAGVRRLDRLKILAEPQRLGALPVLRIGYPSSRRSNPIFACARATIALPDSASGYRVETIGKDSFRMIRDASVPSPISWPDMMLIRLMDDAADQEIALERGELDVGVFWPGELSTHMRERRSRDILFGRRAQGVVEAQWETARARGSVVEDEDKLDRLDLDALNRQLFRGDLAPWPKPDSGVERSRSPWSPRARDSVSFTVDPSFPGRVEIERFLNRGMAHPPSPDARRPTLHLSYHDAVRGVPHTLVPLERRPGDRGAMEFAGVPLFAIRCAVVCRPEVRSHVIALGPDRLVDLLHCDRASTKP